MKIPKPAFTPEFRDLTVKRVKAGESVAGVTKEWGRVEQTLRHGVKAAAKGTPNGAGKRMVTPEEIERSRRRAENARLKADLERAKNRPTRSSEALMDRSYRRVQWTHAEAVAESFLEG